MPDIRTVVFTVAFVAVAVGCWLIHPAAGLIVPGTVICVAIGWTYLRGQDDASSAGRED